MNLATTQSKQKQQQRQSKSTTTTTTTTTSTATTTITNKKSTSSFIKGKTLPKTLITVHNYFGNFRQHHQEILQQKQLKQKLLISSAAKLSLMIKNIESTTNPNPTTDCDDIKENVEVEEEVNEFTNERRESVPEDLGSSTAKLITIQETTNESSSNTQLSNSSSTSSYSSQQLSSAFGTSSNTSGVSSPIVVTLNVESFDCDGTSGLATTTDETQIQIEQQQQQQEQKPQILHDNSIDNIDSILDSLKPQLRQKTSSSSESPHRKSSTSSKDKLPKSSSRLSISSQNSSSGGGGGSSCRCDEDTLSKLSDTTSESFVRGIPNQDSNLAGEKSKISSRLSERAKKKSWYNVIYPNYKSRAEDFKKLFKDVPNDERLIVDYSCALQRDILVQGRLYVSQNYVCFHANIFSWETYLTIKWKDVTAITKEKTALVIPNAISISTGNDKYFFATFTTRDKSFLMLFRVWQNILLNKTFSPQEIWQYVHNCYGEELGLTTDDEDYIDPTTAKKLLDNETDIDFVSALDTDTVSSIATSDYNTVISNSNPSINQTVIPQNQLQQNTSGNSSTGSGGAGSVGIGFHSIRKSKSKTYFFSTQKSNLNSSANASASGSDNNKASDSNSKTQKKMKAKELTLSSAKPEEQQQQPSATINVNGGSANTASSVGKLMRSPSAPVNATIVTSTPTSSGGNHDGGKRKVSKNSRQRDEELNKIAENLPTDISDSSDSEENNMPFVATAECSSTHEGRQILHTILPINIDTLFNLLFSKSKFLTDFHAMRKSNELLFGEWSTNDEGQRTRIVNVTVQLAASVGPKTSKVTEYQMMRDCTKPGELYSIDINSVNAGIPYADSFSVQMHYCLVRTVDDHTMMSVHAQIKYKKSIWGVVKGFIEKNTWAGLEDFYTSMLHALQSETCIPPAKGKGRRPRRGKHKINGTTSVNIASNNCTTTSNVNNTKNNIHNTSSTTTTSNDNNSSTLTTTTLTTTTSTTDNDSVNCDSLHCSSMQQHQQHKHLNHHRHCNHAQNKLLHRKNIFDTSKGTVTQVRPLTEEPTLTAQIKTEPTECTQITNHNTFMSQQLSMGMSSQKTQQNQPNNKFKKLSIFVILFMCFLIALNVILLLKLWKLEERIDEDLSRRARLPNIAALKELPDTHQDWLELLREQEILHETELKKWHQVLQTAIELLKKTEKTLAELLFR